MQNTEVLKVLVDADFLVNDESKVDQLFKLIESHDGLETTVISVCLERACDSRTRNPDDLLSTFPPNRINVISRHDLTETQVNSLLANIESVNEHTKDFDSQLEIAYALTLNIDLILTDKKTDFGKVEIYTPLKLIQIDGIILTQSEATSQSQTNSPVPVWIKSLSRLIVLFSIALLGVFLIPTIIGILSFQHYCPLDNTGSFISCGETSLIPHQDPNSQVRKYQNDGNRFFKQTDYKLAVSNFRNAYRSDKSPESLIYLNNALLEANKKKANTIAVTVPTSITYRASTNEDRDLAKEILRGVAHVQTLINKCILPPNELDFLPDLIKQNNSLCGEIKAKGKGLRVIIADDANAKSQAQNLADQLNELKDKSILAVIGHYASDLTEVVIEKYNENKLVLLSPGSTSEFPLFMKPDDYFFRTVPSVTFPANKLVQYMKEEGYKNPAIFYNEGSAFSSSMYYTFKIKAEGEQIPINPRLVFNNRSDGFAEGWFNVSDAIDKSQSADVLVLFQDGQTSKSFDNVVKIIMPNNGNKPILGTWNLRSNRILIAAKDNPDTVIDGKLIVYNFYDQSKTPNRQYVKEGEALWGNASPVRTATSYDAAWVLVNAFLQNSNRTKLKDTLKTLQTIENGATGDITFDENGNRKGLEEFLLEVRKNNDRKDTRLEFVPLTEENSQ